MRIGGCSRLSTSEPLFDTVIIRFGGEIGIKGAWTRKLYERRLIENVRAVLKHYAIPYNALVRRFGRLYLKTPSAWDAAKKLSRVFGLSSLSPALETTSKMGEIVDKCVYLAGLRLKKGNSFAAKCRRVGKHPYTSQEVCREVGRRILEAYPLLGLRVDLTRPNVTLAVEVREDRAFIYADAIQGVGGLPLGVQPRVVCLLKGGARSAAACWLAMKRGCPPVLVHFDNDSFSGQTRLDTALDAARVLFEWAVGFPRELHVIANGLNIAEIVQKCPRELTSLVCKRLMLRIAERTAESEGAEGIVTGDVLGEGSTHTINAFKIQDTVSRIFPVHRPLLGFDTIEIENLTQKIGIHKTVAQEVGESAVALKKLTLASVEDVCLAEEKLNINELVKRSMETIKTLSL